MLTTQELDVIKQELGQVRLQHEANVKALVDPLAVENVLLRKAVEELTGRMSSLEGMKGSRRGVVPDGKYAGMDILDLALCKAMAEQATEDEGRGGWLESLQRALTTTGAGTGMELLGTDVASVLWSDVNLATMVAPLFPRINMPSDPFKVPRQLGDVNFYPGAQNTAGTATDLATGDATLDAKELVGQVDWSYDLDEDAVVAMMPTVRETLVRGTARVQDEVLLNADTATVADNINKNGTAVTTAGAGEAQWLVGFDGLRKFALVTRTASTSNVGAGVDNTKVRELRAAMGKYGVNPSEVAMIVGPEVYFELMGLTSVQTLDKYGPRATVLTGELGALDGMPIIVSEFMRKTGADGKVSDTAATNTKGQLLMVNRTQWVVGYRREMLIEVFRDIQKRQVIMVVSLRMAFNDRTAAAHTALGRNITL